MNHQRFLYAPPPQRRLYAFITLVGAGTLAAYIDYAVVIIKLRWKKHQEEDSLDGNKKVEVYSLVSSSANHPTSHNFPSGHRTCSFISHLNSTASM